MVKPPTCWCCGALADELYTMIGMQPRRVRWTYQMGAAVDRCLCADCTEIIAEGGDNQQRPA